MSKNSPQLRFEGFTDDWEERKLGDITKISTGKLDANAMVENGKYDFYTSGIKKYRIDVAAFEGPSITIAGNGATVGYMHLADNKFNAYQRTYVLQEFLVDRSFIFSEIGNKLPKKIKQEARTGNIPYIVMDMLTELKLSIPQNNSEQQKIGSFFKQLDETIALHQRKLDLLKEQKKGYLQKMFPKNGAKVPELRFEGFADDWEQRKLEELGNLNRGKSKHRPRNDSRLFGGEYPFIQTGDVAKAPLFLTEYSQTYSEFGIQQSKLWDIGTLLITIAANIADTTILGIKAAFPDSVIGFESTSCDVVFIKNYIDIQSDLLKRKAETSSQANLNLAKLKEMNLNIPKLKEQQKIGSFFQQLDETIALHQRKLDLLKEQKKGFLQKMFV
ncbi:restriction endonuclease subunit S [Streptococcus dysgalactiae subsp. dysgalactiae]|uniref:Restriction endonuclease subunit S n=2 Tax=Streptococcus dysgalactiae TaxID=1334 RepID=A0A9X7SGN4_STRDY|nr:restriction endonuclease subunit S [Streptococcus dysgalactiae subsp. dysgalactiae]